MKLTAYKRRVLIQVTAHDPGKRQQYDIALLSDGNVPRKLTDTIEDRLHPSGTRKFSHGWEPFKRLPTFADDGTVYVDERQPKRNRVTPAGLELGKAYLHGWLEKVCARGLIEGPLPRRTPRESATGSKRRATLGGIR